ncbi:MAG: outer membrane beta-barrel protein [Ferruginibacter sp.]
MVKNNNKTKKANLKFYAGIIAGPDVSSVKLQIVKKTGFGLGLVTGYHINKKWSVETGLLFDKKYYSTDGKHFSLKNMPISGYYTIDYADGSCNMLEIPLNIRYQFKQKERSALFVSAGMSSYLMKKEYYNYTITRYGVSYTKDATYNESRNNFASVANISGGYTRKLGSMEFRIEPYLRLPLRKVGIGSLPLQSAGLHIGITKKFF